MTSPSDRSLSSVVLNIQDATDPNKNSLPPSPELFPPAPSSSSNSINNDTGTTTFSTNINDNDKIEISSPTKEKEDPKLDHENEEYDEDNNHNDKPTKSTIRRILRTLLFYFWMPYNPRDPILRRSIWFDFFLTIVVLFVPWLVGGILLGLFYHAPTPGPNTRLLTPDQVVFIERLVGVPTVLSTVGSFAVIVIYIILRIFKVKRGTGIHMRLILFLSMADLIFDVSIFGVIFFPSNATICYIQAAFSEWGPMCSCLWTFCIAFTLYQNLIKNRPQKQFMRLQIVYHILCWGMPTLFAILVLALQMPSHQLGWCWIDNRFAPWRFLFFYLFLAIIFTYNFFVYLIIILFATKSYLETRRYSGVSNSGGSRNVMRKQTALLSVRLAWFLLAFLLTWIWGLTNRVLNLFMADQFFVLLVLHTFFTPFQGFLNMLAYGAGFRGGIVKFIKDKIQKLITRIRRSR